ncbi:MAG: glycoside hydrolase family 28 protein [Phycisphaerae bacterium]|nr:glycosyl hydrolase family 28 protein [Tepidisphaeraceae bacterium]
MTRAAAVAAVLLCCGLSARAATFTITDHGAVADGKSDSTAAIDRAVEAAGAAGGGVVRVPPGTFVTGGVELRSDVTLQIDKGATLLLDPNPARYRVIRTRWGGVDCYNFAGLIVAKDADRVAVIGEGTIDGRGAAWWPWKKTEGFALRRLRELAGSTDDAKRRVFGLATDALRPPLVLFARCTNVTVDGVMLANSPMAGVHLLECDGAIVRNATIAAAGPDTDGVLIDSSSRVLVERCTFEVNGDAVALAAGFGPRARAAYRPTTDVAVRDCTVKLARAALSIGPDSAAGVRNVTATGIRNTDPKHPDLKSDLRGLLRITSDAVNSGDVSNLTLSELTLKDVAGPVIEITCTDAPTAPGTRNTPHAGSGAESDGPDSPVKTPRISDVQISKLTCDGARDAIKVRGHAASPVTKLVLRDVEITRSQTAASLRHVSHVTLDALRLSPKSGPALTLDRAAHITVDHLRADALAKSTPLVSLKNAAHVTLQRLAPPKSTETLLQLAGPQTNHISLADTDAKSAKTIVEKKLDLPADLVLTVE